jgi:prepilin-type N-terminal cleavage/methylation domain-containing protein
MTSFPSAKTGWRARTTSGTGEVSASRRAFTLVELVIAISVLAILTGLAVPAIDSVQILFDGQGFRASRFLRPYAGPEEAEAIRLDLEQIAEREEMIEASQARGIQVEEAAPPDPKEEQVREGLRYFQEYDYPADVQVSVRFWNDIEWVPLTGAEYKRWIFQPSGMCEPMRFRVEAEKSFFEVEFHPLTADVKSEKSWVE